MFVYIAIACLIGLTGSSPVPPVAELPVPSYGFNYAVHDPHTGDNKAQTETRDGGVVRGTYSLTEPDGTLRVVDYVADPINGFNAVVRRSGPSALPAMAVPKAVAPIAAPLAGHIAAPIAAAPFGHSSQIGGGAATIVPVGRVSIDSIPNVANVVGFGGYGHSGLGATGYSDVVGLGGYGYSGLGADLGVVKG